MEYKLDTEIKRDFETQFLGTHEAKFSFRSDGTKMTEPQKRIVKEFIDNHIGQEKYHLEHLNVFVCKYFVDVHLWYFPKGSKNTVYCTRRKHLQVGKRGGIRKMETNSGLGKEINVTEIYEYYLKADD